MTNRKFFSVILTILLVFVVTFCTAGCGGSSSNFVSKPNDPVPTPTPEPILNSEFTVTFNSNGGTEVASITVTSGSTIEAPTNPTKEGYAFAGWYKDKETFNDMFIFGTDGDKITEDITLYASWLNYDTLIVDYAIGEVVIGYANGNNAKHVTQNLTLPTKIYSADIEWTSNSGAISTNGIVKRQNNDTDVILTAQAIYKGKKSEPRIFNLKVIRKRTRDNSKIKDSTIENVASGDISITRNESGDITNIEGQYVSFDINNADDALDAVTVLRNELGIKNPAEELEIFLVTSDKYSSEYAFSQVHKGVKVWGHNLVVSTNSLGKGDFLYSSFVASNIIDKADGKNDIGSSVAESKAKGNYSEEVEVDSALTEKIIYSLEDYENEPVYAYVVRVYTTSGDKYIDESVFINANTGKIITTMSNTSYAFDMRKANGINELGKPVSFNVLYGTTGIPPHMSYIMRDPERYIQINYLTRALLIPVDNQFNTWQDRHQISVYSNMCEIMSWWKKEFGRDSIDGNGTTLDVVTHALGDTDNALWNYSLHRIFVYDKSKNSSFDHSCGAAVDFLTHETTHGVIQYITGGEQLKKNAAGAINEGYADIFACIKDKNWKFAEDLFDSNDKLDCDRNIASPNNAQARIKARDLYTTLEDIYNAYKKNNEPDNGYVHNRSLKVSHAAYLMHISNDVKGLTWKELGDVWYKSMHKGLNATSKFEDVQRCVMTAAKELHLSSEKIFVIESAFSQLGYDSTATLTGTITDYDTKSPITAVRIKTKIGNTTNNIFPNDDGYFSAKLPVGENSITFISVPENEYVTFSKTMKLEAIAPRGGNVLNVALVKAGSGSVSGTAYKVMTSSPIEGVTVKIRRGHDIKNGEVLKTTTTDSNGRYSFDLGENGAGYYTIEMTKNGYKIYTFNVTVSRNTTGQNGYLIGGSSSDEDEKEPEEPDEPDTSDISEVPIDEEHFPDEKFRSYINSRNNIDTDHNGILTRTEIAKVTRIYASYQNFSSLKGIEYFTNLQELGCDHDNLTALDISKNTALLNLDCSTNKLTNLDLSNNTALLGLECSTNKLTALDLSNNTALLGLKCSTNKLTALDLSNNTALESLNCGGNQLITLDISKNIALTYLYCVDNQLIDLNISNNPALEYLYCAGNQLIDLNISNNPAMRQLFCSNNQLTTLDLSNNTALLNLDCYNNQLTTLDLSNNRNLLSLNCYNNQLTTLDLSNCTNFYYNDVDVICDSDVEIIWPTSSNSASTNMHMHEISKNRNTSNSDYQNIVALIPNFTAKYTGIYSFDISFDTEIPSSSILTMRLFSDDESSKNESCIFLDKKGSQITMPLTDNIKSAKVSAYFNEGVTYSPVIIAQSDESSESPSNSGGCNAGMFGIFILLTNIVLVKKR